MKVLYYNYDDGSGFGVVRVYTKTDYQQADKDLELLQTYGSDSKSWYLVEVELFNRKEND